MLMLNKIIKNPNLQVGLVVQLDVRRVMKLVN